MKSDGGREETEDAGTLQPSDIHDVLRNDRRRHVLERLRETGTEQSVRDLAEHIAAIEAGETPPPRNVRQSVYVSLHQTHLPKLDELGIVSYDSNVKEVALADNADKVAVYMEIVPKYAISWAEFYFGLGLLGVLALVGRAIRVPLLSLADPLVLGGTFLGLVTVAATYQLVSQERSLLHRLRGD